MTNGPLVFAVCTIVLVPFLHWLRARSPQARERASAKAATPGWLKLVEMLIWAALFLALATAMSLGAFALHHVLHPNHAQPSRIAGFLIVIPCLMIALTPALLLANLVSWLVPAMRRANEAAMRDRPAASFRQSAKDLIRFGTLVAVPGLAALAIGLTDPWLS